MINNKILTHLIKPKWKIILVILFFISFQISYGQSVNIEEGRFQASLSVAVTSFALFRDLLGSDAPFHLDGTPVQDSEDRAGAFVSTATSGLGFGLGKYAKSFGIRNYSTNAANRSDAFNNLPFQTKADDLVKTNRATIDGKRGTSGALKTSNVIDGASALEKEE